MQLKDFFGGLLEYKKQCGACQKTINEYQNHLNKILICVADIELKDLRQTDVGKIYEAGRQHGRFGPLRGGVVFRQLLRYIKYSGHSLNFDWRDIQLPKEPRKRIDYLDKDEWLRVRNAFDLSWIVGLRDRALVETLRATGMRIGEAIALNRNSVNFEKKEAIIKNGKYPYEEGKIYFTDESIMWLKRYLQMRNDNFEPMFVAYTGRRCLPSTIRISIHRAVREAGITKRIHPHIFRSTFATELLRGGTDIKTVQNLCRHESERTTLRHYTAWSKERSKGEHARVLNTGDFIDPIVVTKGMSKIVITGRVLKLGQKVDNQTAGN